jgi:opacity protein-like surface antigen
VRRIGLLLMAMVLLLTFSSTALASQSESFVFYGDSKIGSVSDGYQGYSWNHSDSKRVSIVKLKKLSQRYSYKWLNDTKWQCNWDNRDSVRYFYVDGKGVSHYFYLDSDRDYAVHQYKDKNVTTQFEFEDKGWK